MKHAVLVLLIALFITSCATSPTGRKQLILLPESQLAGMGLQSFNELKSKTPIEHESRINNYVRCVTDPILRQVGNVEGVRNWEVVVFRDDQVNAFALPGGRVGVYTGLFKAAQNADQLAAVLGHEVGHVLAKHGNERVSETFFVQGGMALLNEATKKSSNKHGILLAAMGLSQFGVILPHSRDQESEADVIGLELMAKAGFDPRESITLWQNMGRVGGGSPLEFLSTHPSHETRIGNLNRNIPRYWGHYESHTNKPSCVR